MVRRWIATSTVAVLLGATALVARGARFAAATEGAAGEARACTEVTNYEVRDVVGLTIKDIENMQVAAAKLTVPRLENG